MSKEYEQFDWIDVIRTEEETGFSKANNMGFVYIMKKYYPDFVIVANNDIMFDQRNLLQKITDSYEEDGWAVLTPDVVSLDTGEHQSPIALRGRTFAELRHTIFFNRLCLILLPVIYPILARKLSDYGHRSYIPEKVYDVVPCGACVFFSKDFIDKEDAVFFPETKFYYEEYILHHRCVKNGYTIMYNPDMAVVHGDGKATKAKAKDEKERLRFMMSNTMESAKIYREYKKIAD